VGAVEGVDQVAAEPEALVELLAVTNLVDVATDLGEDRADRFFSSSMALISSMVIMRSLPRWAR
jgi:hypothetical protein